MTANRKAVSPGHRFKAFVGSCAADDPTGKPQAVWKVKEQPRALLRTNSLADAAAAKEQLKAHGEPAGRPETNKLYRTVCRWRKEIEA